MPRLRNKEDNERLKQFCLAHYYYDGTGSLFYNKNTPYSVSAIGKKYFDHPLPLTSQVMTTPTGATYEYLTVDFKLNGKQYKMLRSRLIWLLVYGDWPTGNILHVDGNSKNCYHGNLVEVSPRIMHIYTRLVGDLDKNKIASKVAYKREVTKGTRYTYSVSCPVVTETTEGRAYDFKKIRLNKSIPSKVFVDKVYDGHMDYIVCTMYDKLNGINLERYHVNKNRHTKIMREYRKRFGDNV
jgi:hypothetical protein